MQASTSAVLCLAATLAAGCAGPEAWRARELPSESDVGLLLVDVDPTSLRREYQADEIPPVPVRRRLRPCCAFGSEIRVEFLGLPIPGYKIPNIVDAKALGPHTYDSGYVHVPSADERSLEVNRENNGLVYTCRGGFVDTAHVRDYADWSLHLGTQIGRAVVSGEGGAIELPDEGGGRRVLVTRPDPRIVESVGVRRYILWLAEWVTWQMSIWHETATWFGWGSVPGFSEEASAFSPEDLYSNALGIRLLPAIVYRGGMLSESLYNAAVDNWTRAALAYLGAVPRDVGAAAAEAVDGHWWDSEARVPAKHLVQRRSFDVGGSVTPWLVPASRAPAKLVAACGEKPEPMPLATPDRVGNLSLADWVTLEIRPTDDLRQQAPFDRLGPVITQQDFPEIVALVREQNREEFGPDADQPD